MGATRLGEEEGYMLVPDGAGALISLSDNKGRFKAPYVKRVYRREYRYEIVRYHRN